MAVQSRPTSVLSAQAAWVLTEGRVLLTNLSAALQAAIVNMPKSRGAAIEFFGTANADSDFAYRVWLVFREFNSSGLATNYAKLVCLGAGIAMLGTATGVDANSLILSTEKIADTLSWILSSLATTKAGPGDKLEVAANSPGAAAYSPTNNGIAELLIPDLCGAYGILVETNLAGGAGGATPAATGAGFLVREIGSR